MKSATPYLNFDGNTREAMTFYTKCFGATLDVTTFGDMGMNDQPGSSERVLHAKLTKGSVVIMASDSPAGMPVHQGDNFWISIECDTPEEQDQLWAAFKDGGNVLMALGETFWGARFGMLRDKYGIGWMFDHELPKQS